MKKFEITFKQKGRNTYILMHIMWLVMDSSKLR